MDSDEYNPYDFVTMYKKLEKDRNDKKKNTSKADKKNEPDSNQQSCSSGQCLNAEDSSESASSSSSGPPKNTSSDVAPQAEKSTHQPPTEDNNIVGPVICIGDFDDGYNMPPSSSPKVSDNAPFEPEIEALLVKHKNNKYEEEVYEGDFESLNRVVNVKVYWRKLRTYQFPIRMYQPIESIFEHFAKLENIDQTQISLILDNKTLSPSDTPKSINYKFYNFIDGEMEFYKSPYDVPRVIKPEDIAEEVVEEEVKFCIKQKDVRHPFFISINKSDKMIILYIKVAEKLGLDGKSFTLVFDGENIKYSDSIDSLDLEGEECFDLFKKKT